LPALSIFHCKLFASAVLVAALTLLVKLTVMAKDIFVAKYFGAGDAFDAFLIAFLLPLFAVNTIAGSFTSAIIPFYFRPWKGEGKIPYHSVAFCSAAYKFSIW